MMATAKKRVMLDTEDGRLTRLERNYLRQIALRLQGGLVVQPKGINTHLEEEMDRVFGEAKTKGI
jgi:hypothetical protein